MKTLHTDDASSQSAGRHACLVDLKHQAAVQSVISDSRSRSFFSRPDAGDHSQKEIKMNEIDTDHTVYNKLESYWNPVQKTIPLRFEEQARRTPDAAALVFAGQELSYQQLDEKA